MEQNENKSRNSELTKQLQVTIRELNLELSSVKDRNKMLELARLDYEELIDSFDLQIRHKRQSIKRKFGAGDDEDSKRIKREEEYVEEAEVKVEDGGTILDGMEESTNSASILTDLDQGAVSFANTSNNSEKEVKKSRPDENPGKSSPPEKDTIGEVINPKESQENQGNSRSSEKDTIFVKIPINPQQNQMQTKGMLNSGIRFLKYSQLLERVDCLSNANEKLKEENITMQTKYNKQQDYLVNLERDVVDIQLQVDALKQDKSDLSAKVLEVSKEKQKMRKQIKHLKKKDEKEEHLKSTMNTAKMKGFMKKMIMKIREDKEFEEMRKELEKE